jgi:quinol-cytochrome oxidoreductase complex cytochrome b subunit
MNLNNLKPAWKQFLLFHSMQPLDQNEILFIIERADRQKVRRLPRFMANTILFIIIAICCQGG